MKTSKRILSLLLAMCLVTGTLVTGVAAISNSTTISDSGGSASALSSEEEESDDVIEIEVSTYEELSAAVTNESYGDKPVLIKMTDDIEITSAIGQSPPTRQWLYATNMVINGQGYTLSASESTKTLDNKMFQGSLNPNSMESVSLTFRNMTIDAKQQYFYSSGSARSANSALILENVTLKNFYSGKISDTSSCSLRFTCNSSYCTGSSLTLNGVPTEDCVGHLMYLEYVPEVNIINSTLETKLAGSTWDVAVYLGVTTDSTLTVEKSTISAHDDESTYMHGIAAYASGSTKTPWTIILDEDSIVSIDARNSDSKALYTNKQGLFILNGCTIRTADDESLKQCTNSPPCKKVHKNQAVSGGSKNF